MNKFWMSGEIDADVDMYFMSAMNIVEAELNRLLEEVSLGGEIKQWAFIAIIRSEDYPNYQEIAKKSSRGKVLEFRLKIPHDDFASATPNRRMRMLLEALSRSIDMMGSLGVSLQTQNSLRKVVFETEQRLASAETRTTG